MSASGLSVEELLCALAAQLAPHFVEPIARRVAELLRENEAAGPVWLDSRDAAEYLGVNRDTLRKLAAAGAIPSEQDGPSCKRYFRRDELDQWRQSGGKPARLRRVA